jgi:hypothetical protein
MPAKILPLREIDFAVKVGFLPKNLWKEFFAYGGLRWQNKLWRQFLKDDIFRSQSGQPDLYFPNPNHPLVKDRAPFIAKPPLLSQFGHDELVARSYLLLTRAFPAIEIKTESQLKKEIPISNKGSSLFNSRKHPDLVIVTAGQKTAIEIELNQKSRSRYRAILRCYRSLGYSRIIYVIRSKATLSAVESAADEVSFPRDLISLGFGSVSDWRHDPASTPIHFERATQTLNDLLK